MYMDALSRQRRGFGFAAAVLLCAAIVFPAVSQDEKLPRYFEFFMKTGGQESIKAEAERDEQIASGDLEPISLNQPAPDFKLPDGFGNTVGLRDYIGKKNVLLSTMRTWW